MSSTSKFKLTIATPLQVSEIPSEEAILESAKALIQSSETWRQGRSYHKKSVTTYRQTRGPGDGADWHCRRSIHGPEEATFDEMWDGLGVDKANKEKEYIESLKTVTLIKQISPSQSIWNMYYHIPPPVSNRMFTVLQVTHLEQNSPRTGYVISIPVDLSPPEDADLAKLEANGVKGLYASVERIVELEDGKTEWRVAVQTHPMGNMPLWVSEMAMAGTIAEDVPSFTRWIKANRARAEAGVSNGKPQNGVDAPTEASTDDNNNDTVQDGAA